MVSVVEGRLSGAGAPNKYVLQHDTSNWILSEREPLGTVKVSWDHFVWPHWEPVPHSGIG